MANNSEETKEYAIVLFTDEEKAPGIILTNWIFDEGQMCYYPIVKTNEARDILLKKKVEPQETWSSNPIRILNFYDTFAEARAHLRKAEDTSNLSSEDEEEQSEQRRVKRRFIGKKFFPIEADCYDTDVPIDVQQKAPKVKHTTEKIDPYPVPIKKSQHDLFNKRSSQSYTSSAVELFPQENENTFSPKSLSGDALKKSAPSRQSLIYKSSSLSSPRTSELLREQNENTGTSRNSTPTRQLQTIKAFHPSSPTTSQFIPQNKSTERRESLDLSKDSVTAPSQRHNETNQRESSVNLSAGDIFTAAELREMLGNICTVLQRIETKVDALQGGRLAAEPIDEEEQLVVLNLPAKNMEDFGRLEKALLEKSTSFKQKFAKRIASVGGRSSRGLINNMLRSLLTDSVAEMFSLTGKAGNNYREKKAFITTGAYKIMSMACKKIYKDETDANIRVAISDWLNQAKVRKTRREKNVPEEPKEESQEED